MPILNLAIKPRFKGGLKFPILRRFMDVVPPVFIAKTQKPSCAAYFFLPITFSTLTSS